MKRFLLLLLVVLVAFVAFEYLTLPNVASLATEHPSTTAFMELRREELAAAGKSDDLQYHWVSYDAISPYLRRAVLVAEDDSFYQHEGVDVEGLKRALEVDLKRKKLAFGGSTITQQLAKNLYLSPSKNPLRKLKEIIIARRLERDLSKKRILELYLNVVEMGERVYGAEAASRFYFHKPASALNPSEAALLAGCLPNPRVMVPGQPNKRLRWRQKLILSRMKRWGYLFEKQVLAEKKPEPQEAPPPDKSIIAPEPSASEPDESRPAETTTADQTSTASGAPVETPIAPAESVPPADSSTQ